MAENSPPAEREGFFFLPPSRFREGLGEGMSAIVPG